MESPLLIKTTFQIHYITLSSELYLPEKDNPSHESHYSLRVYQPKQYKSGGYPVLMYTHGGGWVLNHLDVYDLFCRKMAERGFVVVSVGYRKAPEHVFPACLNDVLNALTWIGKNLKSEIIPQQQQSSSSSSSHQSLENKFNANVNQLTISGDSAGAHLSIHALVRIFMSDPEIVKREQIPKVSYQALFYPAAHFYMANKTRFESYKLFASHGYILDDPVLEKFWRYLVGNDVSIEEAALNPYLSILSAMDPRLVESKSLYAKFPSGFVISAEYDILRDEAAEFAKAVTEASNGTSVLKHLRTPKVTHGFAQFPSDEMANHFAALIKSYFASAATTTTTTTGGVSQPQQQYEQK